MYNVLWPWSFCLSLCVLQIVLTEYTHKYMHCILLFGCERVKAQQMVTKNHFSIIWLFHRNEIFYMCVPTTECFHITDWVLSAECKISTAILRDVQEDAKKIHSIRKASSIKPTKVSVTANFVVRTYSGWMAEFVCVWRRRRWKRRNTHTHTHHTF